MLATQNPPWYVISSKDHASAASHPWLKSTLYHSMQDNRELSFILMIMIDHPSYVRIDRLSFSGKPNSISRKTYSIVSIFIYSSR
jgi:hypothetical protein